MGYYTADQAVELIHAMQDGKTLEYRYQAGPEADPEWYQISDLEGLYGYIWLGRKIRIKPAEFWRLEYKNGTFHRVVYESRDTAQRVANELPDAVRVVRFCEAPDKEG